MQRMLGFNRDQHCFTINARKDASMAIPDHVHGNNRKLALLQPP
jgi:hypothetical protein